MHHLQTFVPRSESSAHMLGQIRISYSRIGAMFGKSKQCINDMHKNYIRGIGQEGIPPFLKNEELNHLKEYKYKLHTSEPFPIYPTIEEISSFIIENFGKYLWHDTIRKMISTNASLLTLAYLVR